VTVDGLRIARGRRSAGVLVRGERLVVQPRNLGETVVVGLATNVRELRPLAVCRLDQIRSEAPVALDLLGGAAVQRSTAFCRDALELRIDDTVAASSRVGFVSTPGEREDRCREACDCAFSRVSRPRSIFPPRARVQ
jgi:hypothetical protein